MKDFSVNKHVSKTYFHQCLCTQTVLQCHLLCCLEQCKFTLINTLSRDTKNACHVYRTRKMVKLERVPNSAAAMWSVLPGTIREGQWHLGPLLMNQLSLKLFDKQNSFPRHQDMKLHVCGLDLFTSEVRVIQKPWLMLRNVLQILWNDILLFCESLKVEVLRGYRVGKLCFYHFSVFQ